MEERENCMILKNNIYKDGRLFDRGIIILDGREKFNSFHTIFPSILTPFPHIF